ncbi:MAG TPA: cell division protein FtsK, partial [Massilia sp.]|nr:cell division protein FtsK [Massilia sp.]
MSKKSSAPPSNVPRNTAGRAPLPGRLARLLLEARWIALAVAFLYFVLILLSYNKADPGWSHANTVPQIGNLGGKAGAWLADLLLFIFGFSAWWWGVLFMRAVWRGYRRLKDTDPAPREPEHQDEFIIRWIGFGLMFAGSVGLEYLRMWSWDVDLPRAPGGVLGQLLGHASQVAFGFTGATLLLLLLFGLGFSLFFQVSWLAVAERIGETVEGAVGWFRLRVEDREDRRQGEAAAVKRDEAVVTERAKHVEKHPAPSVRAEPQLELSKAPATARPALKEPRLEPDDEVPAYIDLDEDFSSDAPPAKAPRNSASTAALVSAPAGAEPSLPPIKIEPQMISVPKGERAVKEQQTPLFRDLPGDSTLPPLALLDEPPPAQETVAVDTLEFTSRLIEKKLSDFGVEAAVVAAYPGPVVTRYEIEPATGVKGSQIVNLARDLARSLSLTSIRVVETIPGKNYMALELPNPKRQIVRLTEIVGSKVYNDSASNLTVALGKDIAGKPVVADLAKMPHLLAPVVTDMRQAGHALNWAVNEMERRYKLMSKLGVRNLAGYNAKILEAAKREEHIPNPFSIMPDNPEPLEKLPTIVIIIDELADLMMVVGKKVEELIARIAQKARAAGIHLILATQRPSVDVITGLIKANIPTRIAFQVSSKIDSRTILDQMGAETLLGMGDMLYMPPGTGLPVRVHGAFVSDDEVHRVVKHLQSMGEPNYIEGILEGGTLEEGGAGGDATAGEGGGESDAMYDQAVQVVLKNRR